MSVLCFGSFASLLKETTPFTKEGVVEVLINAITSPTGTTMDKGDKSRLLNSRMNMPTHISDCVGTPAITDTIEEYFIDNIIPHIQTVKINELISRLLEVINGDTSIVDTDKAKFFAIATIPQLALFLSSVYHFSVPRQNKHKKNPLPVVISSNDIIRLQNGRIYLNGEEIALPDKLVPPTDFSDSTMPYIIELLRAYAEVDCVPLITPTAIPQKYQRNFNEQRQNYFNAEAVRRRVREVSATANNEFDIFKEDTYNGIIDVHDQTHANGYERLLKVLQQAASLPQGRSFLEKLPKWIGSSEKKGVCHILVNEGKITWVVSNE